MVSQFNTVQRVYTGVTSTLTSSAIYYMREITVSIKGSNIVESLDNIECTF